MLIFMKLDRAMNGYYIWDSNDDTEQKIDTDELKQIQNKGITIYGLVDGMKCLDYIKETRVFPQDRFFVYGTVYRYGDMRVWHNHNNVCVHNVQHKFPAYSYVFKGKAFKGVDLGIKELAVCSNGYVAENINYTTRVKKIERRKKRLQRKIANKYEIHKQGKKYIKTNNIKKLEKQVALLDRKLRNIRDTYIHQITYDLVKTKPKRICIEDLNVSGLMKNKYLAKSIQEQEWSKFRQYLTYKCDFYGIELVIADRKYASSQLCHKCGYKNPKVRNLSVRNWVCPQCRVKHDRDYNASLNLMQYAM